MLCVVCCVLCAPLTLHSTPLLSTPLHSTPPPTPTPTPTPQAKKHAASSLAKHAALVLRSWLKAAQTSRQVQSHLSAHTKRKRLQHCILAWHSATAAAQELVPLRHYRFSVLTKIWAVWRFAGRRRRVEDYLVPLLERGVVRRTWGRWRAANGLSLRLGLGLLILDRARRRRRLR